MAYWGLDRGKLHPRPTEARIGSVSLSEQRFASVVGVAILAGFALFIAVAAPELGPLLLGVIVFVGTMFVALGLRQWGGGAPGLLRRAAGALGLTIFVPCALVFVVFMAWMTWSHFTGGRGTYCEAPACRYD